MAEFNRRRVLRGVLDGGAITVGLPLLNCFLNGNGNAFADGTALPVRYGTWFWGLGMSKSIFVPKKTGAGFDLPEELTALKNVRDNINLYTNLMAYRDGAFFCHFTGWVVFSHIPDPIAFTGMGLIALCGLGAGWLGQREHAQNVPPAHD